MPTSRRRGPLRLAEETPGDKFRRAYYACRGLYGLTYKDHAVLLQRLPFRPCSDQQIMRLNDKTELPSRPRDRLFPWLVATAYGFDPADLGVPDDTVDFGLWEPAKLRKILDPQTRSLNTQKSMLRRYSCEKQQVA